jgi:YebC/PmpR family DNA-binding regulatory protein
MSGHSKWHNIRVRKMATDAKKGKVYTKYARLIEIAAREGGGDTVKNSKLRGLIDNAKAESVPNANIERAIKKGTGELKGDAMQEVTYEAYGPGGAAFIIECLTDNKNRTLGNVKLILSKNGGRFAESGSVAWMFSRKGIVTARNEELKMKNEELELMLIDVGAEDIQIEGNVMRVVSDGTHWSSIRDALKSASFEIASAGLEYVPSQTVPVGTADMEAVMKLVDALEEDDDVSTVHTNAIHERET